MSTHIEHAIADLDTRIAKLTEVRDSLRSFLREFPHSAAAVTPRIQKKAAKKKRTDGRTEQEVIRRRRAVRSLPDDASSLTRVIACMEKRGGWSLKDLVSESGLSKYALRDALARLVKLKQVVITGSGRGQRVSPKEAL